MHKLTQHFKNNLNTIRSYIKIIDKLLNNHPYVFTVLISFLYLGILQFSFSTSGDTWAESFYEYVHNAVSTGSSEFFKTGIAGYYNFLPKLLSYSYVHVGLPLGYIDHFLRASVVVFAVLCIGFIGHPYNKHLIKNNYIRITFALLMLMALYHVSSFSFINVWYVGFIPIILISLHNKKINKEITQVGYAAFAMMICLTKPSIILLPFVMYRMIRLKEWLLGSIILFAISLQTLLFFTSAYYHSLPISAPVNLFEKFYNVFLYAGLSLLKLLQLPPSSLLIVILAGIFLLVLSIVAIKSRSLLQASLIVATFILAIYTAIYSPDAAPIHVAANYSSIFGDIFKLQREILIDFFVLLLLFISVDYINRLPRFASRKSKFRLDLGVSILLFCVLILVYRPIDTQSSNIHINIDSFRSSLTKKDAICMPIPITPSWVPGETTYGWYYESRIYGSCLKQNYEKQINYSSFVHKLSNNFVINNDSPLTINSILIPIVNPTTNKSVAVQLKNIVTGKVYYSTIEAKKNNDKLSFVAFNLNSESLAEFYTYRISEVDNTHSNLTTGLFTDESIAYYPYFINH